VLPLRTPDLTAPGTEVARQRFHAGRWVRAVKFGARWVVALGVLAACATPQGTAPPLPDLALPPPPPPPVEEQRGTASWYGEPHHGQKTASGEIFDMHKLTAAHRTLPLGTRLVVTNLRNGKSVQVRVNDRGPTIPDRIIDLSLAAARALDAVAAGLFPVSLRVVDPAPAPAR
jgi:hypothetical protein